MWLEPPDEPSSRDLTRVPTRCSWSMYGALYAQQIAQRGVRNAGAGAGASRAEVPGTTNLRLKGPLPNRDGACVVAIRVGDGGVVLG